MKSGGVYRKASYLASRWAIHCKTHELKRSFNLFNSEEFTLSHLVLDATMKANVNSLIYAVPARQHRGRSRGCRAGQRVQAAARATVGTPSTLYQEEQLSRLRTENRRLRERLRDEATLARRGPPLPPLALSSRPSSRTPRPFDRRRLAESSNHPHHRYQPSRLPRYFELRTQSPLLPPPPPTPSQEGYVGGSGGPPPS